MKSENNIANLLDLKESRLDHSSLNFSFQVRIWYEFEMESFHLCIVYDHTLQRWKLSISN